MKLPLLDILKMNQSLTDELSYINSKANDCRIKVIGAAVPILALRIHEKRQVEESYEEDVVVKPGGIFRKAITEKQIRTRTVSKAVATEETLEAQQFDIYNGFGKLVEQSSHIAPSSLPIYEFCLIPAGSFNMGDKSFGPIHQVTISRAFYMGKYPVTQAQWQSLMGNNPSNFNGADRPVENVSWDNCQAFISRLNNLGKGTFRLPTEAEWEYSCRAGSTGTFSDEQLEQYAWFGVNSGGQSQPVGRKKPNAWGLYDMHGNVEEFCQDWYEDYSAGAITDPQGPASGEVRVTRGGGWSAGSVSTWSTCRSAANLPRIICGFRLVLTQLGQ
jgi:formylglycine-generating enzyme required for sulfatase activity